MLLAACGDILPPLVAPPVIESAAVAPNSHNVLSAVLSATVQQVDSVAVWFRLAGAPPASDSVTPAVPAGPGALAVPVLGLLPASRYLVRAVAFGPGGRAWGDTLELLTGALPADLPSYTAGGSSPSDGYLVFGAGRYGVVIDNTGRVVWYRHFPGGTGLSFMAQPSGRYTSRLPTPDLGDIEPWVEIDPLGEVTRTLGCAGGLQPRLHDLIGVPDGSYWIMCDQTRTMDLSALGGNASARVTGTVVQHLDAAGVLLFEWSPFDHFAIIDLDSADRTGPTVNWTHGNAIELTADGNLLLSTRSLGEITKIDTRTGSVIWRLGGRANQFAFLGTPVPAFRRQHGVRAGASGAVLLLDNVGDPTQSRAERYAVDEGARTAVLDRSFASSPGVVTQIGGSVQDLPGGRTLVSFGTAGRVEEYDASGQVVWRIDGNAGYVFRAQRIRSLYQPGAGSTR